jgi:hypothetical protein
VSFVSIVRHNFIGRKSDKSRHRRGRLHLTGDNIKFFGRVFNSKLGCIGIVHGMHAVTITVPVAYLRVEHL